MGIPGFYKWLLNKYPKAVSPAILAISDDPSSPNPNGFEFDNLYLDLNGIIHPCFQPDDSTRVFFRIFRYVDRLFNIVRPRKLIYFAIDGVAPRAKLNKQRGGYYRSSMAEKVEDRLRDEYERAGKKLPPKADSQVKDSNVILPGTEFMCEFSKALQVYIQIRLQETPAWKNLKVILSDANVPGEGEHKIMSFIRSQRSLPDYDVNTRHCLHGLDADLIILALATHELHISILREEVVTVDNKPPTCGNGVAVNISGSSKLSPVKGACPYQFLHVWILREYLELEMQPFDIPEGFKLDTERVVDDFVLLSFFVGNDFLPHLPSLGTHERALDLLMRVYKRDFRTLGGYIVDAQQVNDPRNASYLNLKRVERLVLTVGSYEEAIFKKRTDLRECSMRRILKEEAKADGELVGVPTDQLLPASLDSDNRGAENDNILENTKQLKEDVTKYIFNKSDVTKIGLFGADKIKYGTARWKERYYLEKFPIDDHDNLESIRRAVVKEYVVGLCWNLLYYYSGVPSWAWFYPYHYGPCASDLKGLGEVEVKFEEGFPFEPFDQLMAILPPRYADALPISYKDLMINESTDIASFFPREIDLDLDGKLFLWQAQVLLPFIDEKRLLAATKKVKEELTEYEGQKNLLNSDLLYVRASSDFGYQLLRKIDENQRHQSRDANGVGGFNLNLHAFDFTEGEDSILCVNFALAKPNILVPRLLEHVKFPDQRIVYESDIKKPVLWHEHQVTLQGHRVPYQTRYPGPPENESTGVAAGFSWGGRGGGRGGLPSPNSRQGLYTHPNWSNTRHDSDSPRGRSSSYSSRASPNSRQGLYTHPNWSPRFTSSQGSRGGQFWTHKDRQDPGAPEHGRCDRW